MLWGKLMSQNSIVSDEFTWFAFLLTYFLCLRGFPLMLLEYSDADVWSHCSLQIQTRVSLYLNHPVTLPCHYEHTKHSQVRPRNSLLVTFICWKRNIKILLWIMISGFWCMHLFSMLKGFGYVNISSMLFEKVKIDALWTVMFLPIVWLQYFHIWLFSQQQ
jgi:hypothetical protein